MKKSKKTKRFIIEQTAEIFNKQGYKGASLTDLTTATKLTKGSIYGNFKNKEEVAIAAFNYNYRQLIKQFAERLSAAATQKEKLMSYITTYQDIFDAIMHSGGCPILNNAVDTDDTNEIMAGLSKKAFADWHRNLVSIINTGKATGEFAGTLPAVTYADLMITTIEGALLLAKSTGERRYFDHAMAHLQQLIAETL